MELFTEKFHFERCILRPIGLLRPTQKFFFILLADFEHNQVLTCIGILDVFTEIKITLGNRDSYLFCRN